MTKLNVYTVFVALNFQKFSLPRILLSTLAVCSLQSDQYNLMRLLPVQRRSLLDTHSFYLTRKITECYKKNTCSKRLGYLYVPKIFMKAMLLGERAYDSTPVRVR